MPSIKESQFEGGDDHHHDHEEEDMSKLEVQHTVPTFEDDVPLRIKQPQDNGNDSDEDVWP